MTDDAVLPSLVHIDERRALTSAQFHQLAQVPAEAEWFANIDNPQTRRAYQSDLAEFMVLSPPARLQGRFTNRCGWLSYHRCIASKGVLLPKVD